MKKWIFFFVAILAYQNLFSQVSSPDLIYLKRIEDSMKISSTALRDELNLSERLTGDSLFTKQLVRAMKVNFSFTYPFDSLNTCSKLYSPDSNFRIITWQLQISEDQFKQRGVIQMRTNDGNMKIFPLIDKSEEVEDIEKHVGTNLSWIGAIYYKIVHNQYNNIPYYTLIGYDENSIRSNRKIIEVLTFKDNNPVFGGLYFSVPNDEAKPNFTSRFVMEYKKGSGARLTYDEELQVIVKEHLISESNQPQRKWTLIGDGDYEGFKWSKGKWAYIEKIFDQITPEGKAPTPLPLRDKNGNFLKEGKKQ
jgi:hypothetical protein